MSTYAADTSVSVEKTRAELETTLARFGADAFGYMTDNGRAAITFRASGKFVRFVLPLPKKEEFTHYFFRGNSWDKRERKPEAIVGEWEQACRSAWRALFLCVKAKLVAVEAKITTFEEEFMAHIVLSNGRTVSEEVLPTIEENYRTGQMPKFMLALPEPK